MTQPRLLDPRAEELLCQEALEGLDDAEQRELQRLLGDQLDDERALLGRSLAGVDLVHTPPDAALPDALRARILADAAPFFARPAAPSSLGQPRRPQARQRSDERGADGPAPAPLDEVAARAHAALRRSSETIAPSRKVMTRSA